MTARANGILSTPSSRTGVLELPYAKGAKAEPAGDAMIIVGYDDAGYGKYDGAGAFKVRNSWGKTWGDEGFWNLPYSIVDGVAGGTSDANIFPLFYTEDFVYISAMTHN